ncbi:F-box protein [Dorcoceras hygrometricum]|uniref:F-box protein n=1 Tax=Dorcoceras hygrometricum TaxID=472368 RepID=A0A2Z7CQ60_9LAMI|nr:F-box protein [Dorcoceras hygrometricum]
MVKRLATSPHDPLGITDSAYKNQSVMVSIQYGPFNTNIPIRLRTIGKSRLARDPITMHTSWRTNSDIACVTSAVADLFDPIFGPTTTKHRLLHASGPHPTPSPDDPNGVAGSFCQPADGYSGIESADGLVLMTSWVTSSYSADVLREQSQKSAGSLHPDARGSDVVEEAIQSQATVHQQMLFGDSDSKTMSFT